MVSRIDESDSTKFRNFEALKQTIEAVAPDARLVEPRIMRRAIRLDRRLAGFTLRVQHSQSYTIDSTRLLAFVDHTELGSASELAPITILLNRPSEQESGRAGSSFDLLMRYWRLLFHSRVHLEIESRYTKANQRKAMGIERRRQLGELVFSEVRSVLLQDRLLFEEHTDWDVYVEFAATWLDHKYFAADELAYLFPSITQSEAVENLISLDVRHSELLRSTSLLSENFESTPDKEFHLLEDRRLLGRAMNRLVSHSLSDKRRWHKRALRSKMVGNHVKAAICWRMDSNLATGTDIASQKRLALDELEIVADKLRVVLGQDNNATNNWKTALSPVLEWATASFWSAEARLLYDLQKIYTEAQTGSNRSNWVGWIISRGQQPLSYSLPILQYVLVAKQIRSAHRRLVKTHLNDNERSRLAELLIQAEHVAEKRLRESIRPIINRKLDQFEIVAKNVPEQLARNKMVEEMLDNIIEYGFTNSSVFRDALSKGDLKLRDVTGKEILLGDQFLLTDRGLAKSLDGVYHPAPVYLRWSQRLSSLAFGTELGRFVTMHLALPFGGAFLAVEGIRHIVALLQGKSHLETSESRTGQFEKVHSIAVTESHSVSDLEGTYVAVLVLATGLLIYLAIHRPTFRAACAGTLRAASQLLSKIFVVWPAWLLRLPLVEQLLRSPAYAPLRTYLIKPGILTGCLTIATEALGSGFDFRNTIAIFLCIALILNSPIGRYADELFTDVVLRLVEDLRVRVFGVLFRWIMDVFQGLLTGLERVLHTLDDWLRFRSHDSRVIKIGKSVCSSLWSVISYFIVLVSTLLIEPQINPIKHFPVVTVAHKLLLPLGPFFVAWLAPFIGTTQANSLVWSTIWLIPGVFGFLVWELRGNWRLYAANRSPNLKPIEVGPHGETMLTLLRPAFHSGTLPKLYSQLRTAVRSKHEASGKKRLSRGQARLELLRLCVQHFIERELIELTRISLTDESSSLSVKEVLLTTNCVQVTVQHSFLPGSLLKISWEEYDGRLVARVNDDQLLKAIQPSQRTALALALTGLFARTGSEQIKSRATNTSTQPIPWDQWVASWSRPLTSSTKPGVKLDRDIGMPP
ncbi:MAG TPA: hypothetical protein DCF63_07430 [Planctomycetaceae bacterium]|nr:hypothetical protein [Planctomycetaceae bacterium]